ncbi:luciferin sulfotransferase-like [Anthonomus grandis grandis]|uniref:luciferin sulfotransferase-like n=1 Tax=Anthonomus grandis grandis TaxID=2921223 RepID=UPI0021653849|nr:luciferin sulfotransferase-like [Anthonomus grandis grandis]
MTSIYKIHRESEPPLSSEEIVSKHSKPLDGVFIPKKFLEIQDDVADWKVNEADVWIVSFPKTGTTWTQEMVWLLLNDLNYKAAEQNLIKRSPQLEATCLVRSPYLKYFRPIIPKPIINSLKYVKSQRSPACIKTHLPWNLLPKEIQKGIKKPKIIYISRNPKDTCVSYYHFSRLVKEFDGTLEEFCKLFLAGKVNFAPFWNHVLPFWRRRNDPNVLFLKYEELKSDLPGVVQKTARFLDKSLTQEQTDKLARHLSFDSMKNNQAVNYDWLVKLSQIYKPSDKNNVFMRKGKVGGYKEAMTPDVIEQFDKWTEENTRGTGLTYF